MDNLKQRIEEILDHELAAYPDPSEYEEICLRNTAEILTKFIQENFVPKEQYEVMKDAMESWKEKAKNPNEF